MFNKIGLIFLILICACANQNTELYEANVKKFGAIGDGIADDTSSILQAIQHLKTSGKLYFPPGIYKTSSTIEVNLGNPDNIALDIYDKSNIGQGPFIIHMDGVVRPDSNIDTVFYIHGGYFPELNINIDGGGNSASKGILLKNLFGVRGKINVKDFKGTALHIEGSGYSGPDRVIATNIQSLTTLRVGRALYTNNIDGFGEISTIWDVLPSRGSLIENTRDLSIGHFENYVTELNTTYSVNFKNTKAIHLGRLLLGNSAQTMLEITNSDNVSIDKLYLLGNTHNIGMSLNDSQVTILTAYIKNLLTPIISSNTTLTMTNQTITTGP